ncbi:hypothetical protein ASE13_11810 [Sphingomonas sp. Root241]|nr:hypothetical protein ASE13_11810 [Sphingomonas sp. Root241]
MIVERMVGMAGIGPGAARLLPGGTTAKPDIADSRCIANQPVGWILQLPDRSLSDRLYVEAIGRGLNRAAYSLH